MKKILKGLGWFLEHFEEIIASILLGVMFLAFGLQILCRFLSIPASKLSEVYQYAFLVALMFGISYANRHDEHIRADIITSRLNAKGKLIFAILGDIATIAFSFGLAYYGMKVVGTMMKFPQQLPLLKIPYWVIYIILPITSITSIIRVIENRIDKLKLMKSDASGGVPAENS